MAEMLTGFTHSMSPYVINNPQTQRVLISFLILKKATATVFLCSFPQTANKYTIVQIEYLALDLKTHLIKNLTHYTVGADSEQSMEFNS